MNSVKIPFGLHATTQRMKAVSEVDRGLACGCVCPACNVQLVANKGEKNVHYFAHHNKGACEGGLETSIHLMAKQVLEEHKWIMTPKVWKEVVVETEGKTLRGKPITSNGYKFEADKVSVEHNEGDIRPDIVLHKESNALRVEVAVTHFVDEVKHKKVFRKGISMIEIDLRRFYKKEITDIEAFVNAVLHEQENKTWINSPSLNKKYDEAIEQLKKDYKKPVSIKKQPAIVVERKVMYVPYQGEQAARRKRNTLQDLYQNPVKPTSGIIGSRSSFDTSRVQKGINKKRELEQISKENGIDFWKVMYDYGKNLFSLITDKPL